MIRYPHLATRLFGVPLLITRTKLDAILAALGPRMDFDGGGPEAYGPGDKGRERKPYYVTEDGIAVIEVIGPLVKRASGEFMSGGPTTYGQVEGEFTDAATDPNIKGILLLVDSSGGEMNGSIELSDLIFSQRGSKPIVAAADGDAFSAAFAIASAADRIFVPKTGGVGSVGVWLLHLDQSGANEQKGLRPTYIYAGARKIDGNPDQPLSDEARQVFQDLVDGAYQMFVTTVARNRAMPASAVRRTEAGLFFGEPKPGMPNAVQIGFADAIGTVADALAYLRGTMTATSSVAKMSATNPERKANNMEKPEVADTQTPPSSVATPTPPLAEPGAPAPQASLSVAREILQLCALAGLTARQALNFLTPTASIEGVRQELLNAPAEADREITSHVLPHQGAMEKDNTDPNHSPVVKACEALAAAKGGK